MWIFIPIKEQSVRVPTKNFRDFGGVPLWEHTINKLKGSGWGICVDTDCDSLVDELQKTTAALVIKRPKHLCGNDVSVNRLIENFLDNEIKDENELICQIHVTSPFLQLETLVQVQKEFNSFGYDSIVSCTEFQARFWRTEPRLAGKTTGGIWIPVNHNPTLLEPTQDLGGMYMENSLFYAFTKKSFKETGNRIGKNPDFFITDFPENLDIDTEDDWKLCEMVRQSQLQPTQ